MGTSRKAKMNLIKNVNKASTVLTPSQLVKRRDLLIVNLMSQGGLNRELRNSYYDFMYKHGRKINLDK